MTATATSDQSLGRATALKPKTYTCQKPAQRKERPSPGPQPFEWEADLSLWVESATREAATGMDRQEGHHKGAQFAPD